MSNKKKNLIKAPKLIITIVDRNKTEFYTDVISQFDVNMQMILFGKGTAPSNTLELLGFNNEKGIILSVVREDLVKEVLATLNSKFKKIKNGKGVACSVSISSVIGLRLYQFMINNRKNRGDVNE